MTSETDDGNAADDKKNARHKAAMEKQKEKVDAAIKELETKYGSIPRSSKRVTALAASFVCRVLKTMWPVSDAWTAFSAVS